ncbi:MAG: YfcE family phosphodiesterase [Planctomycetota bacterium]|nr:MAG: YfcE family phosphodiesterase [Planctomycetota bacterium]REJ88757.1 MAG: YfcE family phosphodiesterase [Planctomycetota bacterium]REK26598.1 MAG: YfcE family phosphodiesterase [Planctomycetota bacterium]REK46099.1 MAG: YfcE family phosphodiesterase [Planctomycetota bacterium]
MRIGIFADSHDHLDNIRLAVDQFNRAECERVIFAGDLVSTIAVPPLRALCCPLIGCFGDNEGNKTGLRAGLRIVATLYEEPPVRFEAADGTRFVIAHMERQFCGADNAFDVGVYGHTHKPRIQRDECGRLFINPGETGGWSFGRPTIVILETDKLHVRVIELT